MAITREAMGKLIDKLQDGSVRGIGDASHLISDAGVGANTWLSHCLLYEHPDAAWIAWEMERNPDATQEEAIRSLRRQGYFQR